MLGGRLEVNSSRSERILFVESGGPPFSSGKAQGVEPVPRPTISRPLHGVFGTGESGGVVMARSWEC